MLYDLRRHCIIDIDGEIKFKCIPFSSQSSNINNKCFYEVRYSKQQLALLNAATNLPLRLPNGSCWINEIKSNVERGFTIIGNSNLGATMHIGGTGGGVLELIYDASSGERYFYDIDKKLFFNEDGIPKSEDPSITYKLYTNFKMPGAIAFYITSKHQNYIGYGNPIKVLINGQFLKINGDDLFSEMIYAGDDFIIFKPYERKIQDYWNRQRILYDLKSKTEVINPATNEVLKFQRYPEPSDGCEIDESRFLFITVGERYSTYRRVDGYEQNGELIFDKQIRGFIKNPCNFPGEYLFGIVRRGNRDGSGIVIIANNNAIYGWMLRKAVSNGDTDALRNFRILDVPGVDNSTPYPEGSYDEYLNNIPRVWANNATQEYSMDDVQQMVREAVNKILNIQL